MIRLLFFTLAMLLCSCSVHHAERETALSFRQYLDQVQPALSAHIGQSKQPARDKMRESFAGIDQAADLLDRSQAEGFDRKRFYASISNILERIYGEYELDRIDHQLRKEEYGLSDEIRDKLLNSKDTAYGNSIDKYTILESRAEAQDRFEQLFNQKYSSPEATRKIVDFVNLYTKGFLIFTQDDPEDYQQYYLDHIAMFKRAVYCALMIEFR